MRPPGTRSKLSFPWSFKTPPPTPPGPYLGSYHRYIPPTPQAIVPITENEGDCEERSPSTSNWHDDEYKGGKGGKGNEVKAPQVIPMAVPRVGAPMDHDQHLVGALVGSPPQHGQPLRTLIGTIAGPGVEHFAPILYAPPPIRGPYSRLYPQLPDPVNPQVEGKEKEKEKENET